MVTETQIMEYLKGVEATGLVIDPDLTGRALQREFGIPMFAQARGFVTSYIESGGRNIGITRVKK